MKSGIRKSGLNLENINIHQYNPIGITLIATISESHVAIHTYPEACHASIDIFTCSLDSEPNIKLLGFLKKSLKPKTIRFIEINRGNPLEIKERYWIESFSRYGFNVKYHIDKNIFSKNTKYQQIDIIENENFGRMLFLDKDLQIAEKDSNIYNTALVSPFVESKIALNNCVILGGGDGGVLSELLKHNPKNVVVVDIDEEVIKASKMYLRCICNDSFDNKNVTIVINDASKYLKTKHAFDAIIYDLTMHPESLIKIDRTIFIEELFSKIRNNLNEDGMITLQCCSEFDVETIKLLEKILPKYFKDINFRKSFIPSYCENWIFASAEAK